MSSKSTVGVYELCFHFVPTLSEKEVQQLYTSLREQITSGGAEEISTEAPEKFSLAFPVRHTVRQGDGTYQRFTESYFGSVKFRASRALCTSLRETLLKQSSMLRFLITETVAEDTRIGPVLPDERAVEEAEAEEGFAVEGSVVEEGADIAAEDTDGSAETPVSPEASTVALK